MILPKHLNPLSLQNSAVAPYNFIPLPDTAVIFDLDNLPDHGVYYNERFTGTVECIIITESPIYIRAALTPKEFQHGYDKPDFFYTDINKTPRIPASSLRGMLRNLVEIVSYSKVERVTDRKFVYRAVVDTSNHGQTYRNRLLRDEGQGRFSYLVKGGYIQFQNGRWFIQPAQEIDGTTFARIDIRKIPKELQKIHGCKNAARIYIEPGPFTYQQKIQRGSAVPKIARVLQASGTPFASSNRQLLAATLARSGRMISKRSESVVYPLDPVAMSLEIPLDLIELYRNQITLEQAALLGPNGVLNHGQPIFYLMEHEELVFFGHTLIMRLPYSNSPRDLVPEELRKTEQLDLSEAIFGFSKEKGTATSYASRVMISDAVLLPSQSNIWLMDSDATLTPKILSNPKPTSFQHYIVQTKEETPIRDKHGNARTKRELDDYSSSDKSVIRGHKQYWHKGQVNISDIQERLDSLQTKLDDELYTRIKPIAQNVKFSFRIKFENLTEEELGAILWVLQLPGDANKEYRHKIGMGKPYGLGAIKIVHQLHLSDRTERYKTLLNTSGDWSLGTQATSPQDTKTYIDKFDRLIRSAIGEQQRPSLAHVPRIQALLTMLEWPGPDRSQTRYLEIERLSPKQSESRTNEFRTRPILPTPLHIAGLTEDIPTESSSAQPSTIPIRMTNITLNKPRSLEEIQPGMYVEGEVVQVETSRVIINIMGEEASLPIDKIVPPVRDIVDLKLRFRVGKTVRVWIRRRNARDKLQLTMHPLTEGEIK